MAKKVPLNGCFCVDILNTYVKIYLSLMGKVCADTSMINTIHIVTMCIIPNIVKQ